MASPPTQPKKPRLSLQIKTSCSPSSRPPRAHHNVDPKDPTAFNTLSNVYSTAIERSTPLTAINTLQAFTLASPIDYQDSKHRVTTPYVAHYPETPLSANPISPRPMEMTFPSTMTATPPLSGTTDSNSESKVFTFSSMDTGKPTGPQYASPSFAHYAGETRTGAVKLGQGVVPYRTASNNPLQLPYSHPHLLHSILRNSPLPPKTAIPPPSPRRQSARLAEKAARRVGYNSPLEQEIITNKYTKSHIDLLAEEASPNSPSASPYTSEEVLDLALAFTANEIQDGGQTPGPFEETRRRMASGTGLPSSPASPAGVRKRKKREKKRRWVWTIGQEEDDGEDVGGAVAALRAEAARQKHQTKNLEDEAKTPRAVAPQDACMMDDDEEVPTPSVESSSSAWDESEDVSMTDSSSVVSEEDGPRLRMSSATSDGELDAKTPTAPNPFFAREGAHRHAVSGRWDSPVPPQQDEEDKMRKRDTPVPPEYE